MGLCFIGKRNFKEFISEYLENSPGEILDVDTGSPIGQHDGVHTVTIGEVKKKQQLILVLIFFSTKKRKFQLVD